MFSLRRVGAILIKEFLQMRRDRVTLAMIIGIPLMQLFLFGFAINFNPKSLPTAVSIADPGNSVQTGVRKVSDAYLCESED